MAREKKKVITNVTQEEMEAAFAEYATADAKIQKMAAQMDIEMTKIREKYAPGLADLGEKRDAKFEIIQVFATENQERLFTKRKSVELAHGVFGFRTGTPKLKTLKKFTWGAVTELLKEFLPDYVHITEEAAKNKLLADRDVEAVRDLFPRVGIEVVQDETFFIECKKEEA